MTAHNLITKQRKHKESLLDQTKLKNHLHYDQMTGLFTWIVRASNNIQIGDIAGYKQSDGYVAIKINGMLYKAHRLIFLYMDGVWPVDQVDHKDHIRDNNKWDNLKKATHQENGKNRSIGKNNTSKIIGVYWVKNRNKWRAYIKAFGVEKHLGLFINIFDAACVRKSAENKLGFNVNHGK